MDSILKTAVAELGEKEVSGPNAHNQTIVNYAQEAGFKWVDDDETPWCSIFVNWVAKKHKLQASNKANARSWLLIGQPVDSEPEPGDVVVFWRDNPTSWKGHVGFFFGFSKKGDRVYCLGGNQGNQVSISAYPIDTILGFRRLKSSNMIALPDPPLQRGDKGGAVKSLQNALKALSFNCGTSDGDFGLKTEDALKSCQSASGFLQIDGIYGVESKDYLLSILNE